MPAPIAGAVGQIAARGAALVVRPVIRLGAKTLRVITRRPVTTAAVAVPVAVSTGVIENPIEDVVDDATGGGIKFLIGAGIIFAGYKLLTDKKLRKKLSL